MFFSGFLRCRAHMNRDICNSLFFKPFRNTIFFNYGPQMILLCIRVRAHVRMFLQCENIYTFSRRYFPVINMRWFKCLLLCFSHIFISFSYLFIKISNGKYELEKHNFLRWFGFAMGALVLSVVFIVYLLLVPFFPCTKKRRDCAHILCVVLTLCYIISIVAFLWGLQHIITPLAMIQVYASFGQTGIVFACRSAHLSILSTQCVAENASQTRCTYNQRSRAFSATHFTDENSQLVGFTGLACWYCK